MISRKKLLIAYDGSPSANAAISAMTRAGFPQDAEAIVLSVADVWFYPPPAESKLSSSYADQQILRRVEEMHARAAKALADAEKIAQRGAVQLQTLFPSWDLRTEAVTDWPGWGIIHRAENWGTDLVAIGCGGRSLVERIWLGSISHKVLANCRCSVRVGRQSPRSAMNPCSSSLVLTARATLMRR